MREAKPGIPLFFRNHLPEIYVRESIDARDFLLNTPPLIFLLSSNARPGL
jgi:hypothetical protein